MKLTIKFGGSGHATLEFAVVLCDPPSYSCFLAHRAFIFFISVLSSIFGPGD